MKAPDEPGAAPDRGEEALIQTYFAPLAAAFPGALGLKDDAAVLAPPPGEELVVTMDAVAAGVHFLPADDAADVAWKALAVNVSDLAAKGARPLAYLMSIAFPDRPDAGWLEKFSSGLAAAQKRFGLCLAGGDTDRREGPLTVTIAAFGTVPEGRMVPRASARPGDRLVVTGTLGDAALGLKLRRNPAWAAAWGLDTEAASFLVARYLRPAPPLALADALRTCASASIDISDGLAKDLGRLAKASGLAAHVEGRDVPLSPPVERALAAAPELFTGVLTGGDDYEILAAVPEDRMEEFEATAMRAGVKVTGIGSVRAGSGVEIDDRTGKPLTLVRPGWDHF